MENPISPSSTPLTGKPIPGDSGPLLIGNSLRSIRDPLALTRDYYGKYGPVFWTKSFGIRTVGLIGPQGNQFVLRNQGDIFSSGQGWDFFIGKFFPRGIMLLDFDEHRHHRSIMQVAFRKNALAEYLARMSPAITRGITRWSSDQDFHVLPSVKQLTLDLATEVFMGQHLGPETDRINKAFVDTVRAGTAILRFPIPGGRWKKGLDGRKLLVNFFRANLAFHRSGAGKDLFSQLCRAEDEQGNRFSDDDVINHMIFVMMAAHDTTTITLCSVLHQLAMHPDWQQRVRDECLGLAKPTLEHEDLELTPVMSMVMKEALRLMPPVVGLPRKTVKDTEFMGYRIPKGSFIIIDMLFTHRMEEYWTRPSEFDPERFSDARQEHRKHPFQFAPFGGGAHTCIGMHFAEMQVKAILHQLVRQYRWSVPTDYRMPVDFTALPVPKDGLPVRLEQIR
jgi:cytochrome P450